METCADCIHWQVKPQDLNAGDCTRFPPTVLLVPQQTLQGMQMVMMAAYPTLPRGFAACGELEFKEEDEKAPKILKS